MPERLGPNPSRPRSYLILGGLTSLLFLASASVLGVHAQSGAVQTEQRVPTEAKPFIVERRSVVEGTKLDPRPRFELRFGEPREKCTTWRIEVWVQPDGHAVFDLKEPADKKVLLDAQFSPRHLELALGDADCNYRIRIERNK